MNLPIVLRPDAEADLHGAREWYEAHRAGLGDDFVAAIDQLLGRVQARPELYEAVQGDVRRGKVKRFPYVVYYRVLADRIEVIGVLHGSRNPQTWQDRI
jgi:plasmid stabilization system protein ParE